MNEGIEGPVALAHLSRRGHPAQPVGVQRWRVSVGRVQLAVGARAHARVEGGPWVQIRCVAELDGWIAGGSVQDRATRGAASGSLRGGGGADD